MTKVEFRCLISTDFLFIANHLTGQVYVIVYVDGLLIFGSEQTVSGMEKILAGLFHITDLGECNNVLRKRIEDRKFLSLRVYTKRPIKVAVM